MKPISFSEPEEIFRNGFLRLYSVQADFGSYKKRFFVSEKEARVGVLLVKEDSVLLVRQYRFLVNDWSWEIPGGGVGADESPEEAAIRECYEEAGVVCRSVIPFFDYRQGVDTTDSHAYLFSSTELTDTGVIPGTETDTREWVPIEECYHMILKGEIEDNMTILALLVYFYKTHCLTR